MEWNIQQKCLFDVICVKSIGMYGKKRSDGEIYYDEQRPLIEVSDTVYVERSLYELFCSLRYIPNHEQY